MSETRKSIFDRPGEFRELLDQLSAHAAEERYKKSFQYKIDQLVFVVQDELELVKANNPKLKIKLDFHYVFSRLTAEIRLQLRHVSTAVYVISVVPQDAEQFKHLFVHEFRKYKLHIAEYLLK